MLVAVTACRKAPPDSSEPTPDPIRTSPKMAESERAKFQGVWKCVSLEVNGEQVAPGVARQYLYRFKGTHYSVARNEKVESKGSFSIDPTKSPALIDLAESTNITIYGIYRFDGDRLTICLHEKKRPTTFKPPPGPGYLLVVLERDKPLQTEFSKASHTAEHRAAAKELQGKWITIAYHGNGKYTRVQPGREVPYTFEGNKQITVNPFNPRQEIEYRLDPTKTPKWIDQRYTGGTIGPWIAKGIYKLEGDRLTICYGGPNVARPDNFTTRAGDGRSMRVLKRVK
jgi:uncharacterized protein (TIGR03067 family)